MAARLDVMHLQKACPPAARRLAAVPIPRQHFSPHPRRDGRRVTATTAANGGVTAHTFGLGPPQFPLAGVRLDGHPPGLGIFMHMDLYRGA